MWKVFSVSSKEYYFNSNFTAGSLNVQVTDFIKLWREDIPSFDVTERFKQCNSIDGEFDVDKIISMFNTNLNPENNDVKKTLLVENETLKLDLSCESKDLSFNFTMTVCSPEEYHRCITLPTLLVLGELTNRQEKLKQLLHDKDEEIAEYQMDGAKLFRSYLRTKQFIAKEFKEECDKKTESNLHGYINSIGKIFNDEVNSIFFLASKSSNTFVPNVSVEEDNNESSSSQKELTTPKKLKWELPPQNVKRFKNKKKIHI